MKAPYKDSFLICFHADGSAAVFRSGLPQGVYTDGEFVPHVIQRPDGTKEIVPVNSELLQRVEKVLRAMHVQDWRR